MILVLKSRMKDAGDRHFQINDVKLLDEVDIITKLTLHYPPCLQKCSFSFCPVCKLDTAIRRITVRGLCPDSVFNSAYTLTMTKEGSARSLKH